MFERSHVKVHKRRDPVPQKWDSVTIVLVVIENALGHLGMIVDIDALVEIGPGHLGNIDVTIAMDHTIPKSVVIVGLIESIRHNTRAQE